MTNEIERAAQDLLAELELTPPNAAPGQNMLAPNARRDVGATPLWRARDGPATLFVHGWNDTHRIWRQFAQDFIANARPVLLMDLPAHGASKATAFGQVEAGQAVRDVCEAEAPIDAIIAHSFGCIATAAALQSGARAHYVILIAPPVLGWETRQRRKGTDPAVVDRVLKILADEGRALPEAFDFKAALAGFDGKLLFIGSDDDDICPLDDIAGVAGRVPGAEIVAVDGLDHRELCLDRQVLAAILAFLGYA